MFGSSIIILLRLVSLFRMVCLLVMVLTVVCVRPDLCYIPLSVEVVLLGEQLLDCILLAEVLVLFSFL